MSIHTPREEDPVNEDSTRYMNDRQRAFKRYKQDTAAHGKPFFPFGVWHDVVAATATMAIIILLSVVWFAQANCDAWLNVSCNHASTPLEQEQYTPDKPGVLKIDDKGKVDESVKQPLLGPLYEEKADPATTSYHPRPEWYFYFLFYLLIVFSEPQLVILGTIGLPTIWLLLLIAWPFIDRRRERRPSRRPISMAAMTVTAAVLLSFTYLGSRAGENEAPEGLTEAQAAMPGYELIYEDTRGETCFGCHTIVTGSGNVGPDLTEEANQDRGLEWQIVHLIDPPAKVPGSTMPAQGDTFEEEEIAQIAAFLETLGQPERAEDPKYTEVSAETTKAALAGGVEDPSDGKKVRGDDQSDADDLRKTATTGFEKPEDPINDSEQSK